MPKLVSCIRHGQRLRPHGPAVAGQYLHALFTRQSIRIQPQLQGQTHIHLNQFRRRYRCRVQTRVEPLRQPRIAVVEDEPDAIAARVGSLGLSNRGCIR